MSDVENQEANEAVEMAPVAAEPSLMQQLEAKIQAEDAHYRELCVQEVALTHRLKEVKKERRGCAQRLATFRDSANMIPPSALGMD